MKFEIEPIGFVRCGERYRFETPRQGAFADNSGCIELNSGCNYEDAAADLAGFGRIWVTFVFHLNQTWNVKVRPPVAPPGRKIGVFATRSPHRPNRLGLSCVELDHIEGRRLFIRNFDMLDGTPVVDIKPYIPAADSFPDSAAGWLAEAAAEHWQIEFAPPFCEENARLMQLGGPDLVNFCEVQLVHAPLDRERKRLYPLGGDRYEIGCRTWRIAFAVFSGEKRIRVESFRSNYLPEELEPGAPDVYGDLDVHRNFLAK